MKHNVYISITSVLILSIRSNLFDTRPKRGANVWRGSMPRYYDIVITIVIVDFAINYTANNPFTLPFFLRLCCSSYIVTIHGYIECYRSYISTVLISRLKYQYRNVANFFIRCHSKAFGYFCILYLCILWQYNGTDTNSELQLNFSPRFSFLCTI